jgi:hypothetical protein
MIPRGWAIAALLMVLLLVAWLSMHHKRDWVKPPTDIEVAQAWLKCLDCQGPFLKRLHEMPTNNRDTVTRLLRSALLSGPDQAEITDVVQDLVKTWEADSVSRVGRHQPPDTSRSHYLDRYRGGYAVRWRGRAAIALGVIRGDSALAALDTLLADTLINRGDSIVHRWAERARADSALSVLGPNP